LGLGGVVFDSVWGVTPPPLEETLLEIRGGNVFTAPGHGWFERKSEWKHSWKHIFV